MECERKACQREYAELAQSFNGSDDDDLVHCGEADCHNIYWSSRNGARCDQCFTDACESCVAEPRLGCTLDDGDVWYCADCRDRLIRHKQLVLCRNPLRTCDNYAHPKDFACTRCGVVVCDDCFFAVFGVVGTSKTLCRACRPLKNNRK
jgi:hypothetical protein